MKFTVPSARAFRIGEYRERSLRKKRFLVLGSIVLVLMVGFFGMREAAEMRERMREGRKFDEFYSEAEELVKKAESSKAVNPESAVLGIMQFRNKLDETDLDLTLLNEEDNGRLKGLNNRVQEVSDSIDKISPVSEDRENLKVFLDLKLKVDKSDPTDIAIFTDERPYENLIVTDRGNKSVYLITIYTQELKKIEDPQNLVQEPLFVDIGVDGIYVYDQKSGALKALFGESMSEIGQITAISGASAKDFPIDKPDGFTVLTQNDNLYLLDSESAIIYRSFRLPSGNYGLPSKFYQDESLKGGKDLFADFSVYVVGEGAASFNRYISSAGSLANAPLAIKGMNGDLGKISSGFTDPMLDKKLYLFNEDNRRIMAFEKPDDIAQIHPNELYLIQQYEYRGSKELIFTGVKDFVVDSSEDKVYILDRNTIWEMKLR